MTFFLGLLFTGLCLGFIYALIALGFVIVFKCSRVFNIAQGAFVLVGAYLGWWLLKEWRISVWLCFLIAIAIAAIIGYLIERLVVRRLSRPATISWYYDDDRPAWYDRGVSMLNLGRPVWFLRFCAPYRINKFW